MSDQADQSNEGRLLALLRASSTVVCRMSPDWGRMLQLDGAGFLDDTTGPGESWVDRYIPAADRPAMLGAIEAAARDRSTFDLEHRVVRADGSAGWSHTRAVPVLDGRGDLAWWLGAASDVTPRKEAEEELRASEAGMRLALEATGMVSWEWDPAADRITLSEGFSRVYGLPALAGAEEGFALVHPGDLPDHKAKVARLALRGGEYHSEFRITRPSDGRTVWLEERASAITDADGRILRVVGIVTDVTDLHRAESEIRHRGEQFETLIQRAPIGVYLVDADFRIAQVNPVAWPVFGDIPDLIGRDFDEVIHVLWERSYADEIAGLFRRTLETGEPYETPERAEFRADRGVVEYYSWRIDRIATPDGRHGVVCYFSDVSGQVRARLAIAESERKYRTLFESIDEGFCIFDMILDDAGAPVDYRFIECNPAFEHHTGMKDAVGRTIRELVPNQDREWFDIYGRVAATGEPIRVVRYGEALGRWIEVYAFRIGSPERRRVAALFSDVSARREAEQALRRTNDDLEARVGERTAELSATLGSLEREMERRKDLARQLGSAQEDERQRVARDLHDSVGQLLIGLSLALKGVELAGNLPPPAAAELGRAQGILDGMGRELHGLAVRLRPTSLDDFGLEPALQQLVAEWSIRSGVRVEFQATGLGEGRLPSEVETTLYRVVQEALTNVARHAGARVVGVVVGRPDRHVTAVIEDDGAGFDPHSAPVGRLGLKGMRERVDLVGGELEVESSPGSGTTIFVRIPLPGESTGVQDPSTSVSPR